MVTDPPLSPLVLVIHGHMSVANLVRYLSDNGLRVTNRSNDAEMLHAVLDIAPDLIVLDFAVNSDTVERLKADGRTRHIPVIGLADIMRFAAEG